MHFFHFLSDFLNSTTPKTPNFVYNKPILRSKLTFLFKIRVFFLQTVAVNKRINITCLYKWTFSILILPYSLIAYEQHPKKHTHQTQAQKGCHFST